MNKKILLLLVSLLCIAGFSLNFPSIHADGAVCGNDITETGEECDDGTENGGRYCSTSCEIIAWMDTNGVNLGSDIEFLGSEEVELVRFTTQADACYSSAYKYLTDFTIEFSSWLDMDAITKIELWKYNGSTYDLLDSIVNPSSTSATFSSFSGQFIGSAVADTYRITADISIESKFISTYFSTSITDIGFISNDTSVETFVDGLPASSTRIITLDSNYCPNGTVNTGEECDDYNSTNGDGCSSRCTIEFCGDGYLDTNGPDNISGNSDDEECDDGAANSNITPDACRTTCIAAYCGDAIVDSGEECDDGNTNNGDGCTTSCQVESCGDGYVDPNGADNISGNSDDETCDDGNTVTGDGCSASCQIEFCGDGLADGNGIDNISGNSDDEECDDGNTTNGDNCSSTCKLESDCGDGNLNSGASGSFSVYINAGTNDSWEQIANGQTYPSGSDLPLGAKQGLFPSIVGLRFAGLPIPEDAIIDDAYLQFATDYVRTNATSLSITTEDSSSPASFSSSSYDLSSRTDVGSSVSRSSIPTWTPVGSTHQSPDVSSIVQDVVDRGDRGSGDAMVFLIDGSGAREAESYEGAGGTQSKRPLLYVEWSLPGEECDDGNTNNGDGCSQTCQDE